MTRDQINHSNKAAASCEANKRKPRHAICAFGSDFYDSPVSNGWAVVGKCGVRPAPVR